MKNTYFILLFISFLKLAFTEEIINEVINNTIEQKNITNVSITDQKVEMVVNTKVETPNNENISQTNSSESNNSSVENTNQDSAQFNATEATQKASSETNNIDDKITSNSTSINRENSNNTDMNNYNLNSSLNDSLTTSSADTTNTTSTSINTTSTLNNDPTSITQTSGSNERLVTSEEGHVITINNNTNTSSEEKKTEASIDDIINDPVFDEHIDYSKDFNLTLEMEKLYKEQTEAEKSMETEYDAKDTEVIESKHVEPEITEEERLRKEWEEQVSNFTAEDIISVEIYGRKHFNFYENIIQTPSNIKVAYFLNSENTYLNFQIYDPKQQVIHDIRHKGQDYLEFTANRIGVYKFVLDNHKYDDKKLVSFAIHTGNNTDHKLNTENIDKLSNKINLVESKLKDFKLQEKLLIKKFEGHYESTKIHNKQIVKYSLIESATMVIIFIFQMFYLKQLLKRIA